MQNPLFQSNYALFQINPKVLVCLFVALCSLAIINRFVFEINNRAPLVLITVRKNLLCTGSMKRLRSPMFDTVLRACAIDVISIEL